VVDGAINPLALDNRGAVVVGRAGRCRTARRWPCCCCFALQTHISKLRKSKSSGEHTTYKSKRAHDSLPNPHRRGARDRRARDDDLRGYDPALPTLLRLGLACAETMTSLTSMPALAMPHLSAPICAITLRSVKRMLSAYRTSVMPVGAADLEGAVEGVLGAHTKVDEGEEGRWCLSRLHWGCALRS
jgi:hypothetical protein